MPWVWWGRLADFMQVQWKQHRTMLVWLVVWLVAGAVFGIVTLYLGAIEAEDINYHLIDINIIHVTTADSGIGSFIWGRFLSLVLPVVVVFGLAALSRVTACAIFPVVFIHGYWLTVAVWWIWFYFRLSAILLLAFYTVWLLLVTAVLLIGLIWAWRWGTELRTNNCPGQSHWGAIARGAGILAAVAVVLGVFEYLVFWTVLGKIVYKAL